MKNTKACNTHTKFSFQQVSGKVAKLWSQQGLRLRATSPSSLIRKCGQFSNQTISGATRSQVAKSTVARALIAACALLLLLFCCIGAVAGIANAQANTAQVLSAASSSVKPTRTPPGRRSPTPTTPAPTPTLAVTITTIPTVLANATPSLQGATPQATQKQVGNPMPTSISTQPTPATTSTVQHPSPYQQKGNPSLLFVILATLIGIGCVILLLVTGLLLLRTFLLPSAKMRLPPSGAPPWQRARIESLDDGMNVSGHRLQTLQTLDASSLTCHDGTPTTDGYLPTMRNVIPSRRAFSSITSTFAFKKKQIMIAPAHFLRPTKLKKMHNSGILAEPRNSAFNLSEQNQSGAALREPWEEPSMEDVPSLDDPLLRETLQYYMLRGQFARQQSDAGEQQEHDPG